MGYFVRYGAPSLTSSKIGLHSHDVGYLLDMVHLHLPAAKLSSIVMTWDILLDMVHQHSPAEKLASIVMAWNILLDMVQLTSSKIGQHSHDVGYFVRYGTPTLMTWDILLDLVQLTAAKFASILS